MSHPMPGMPQAWSRVAREYRRHIAPDFLPAARELGAARVLGVDYARGMIATAGTEAGKAAFRHLAVPPSPHNPQWGVPERARSWLAAFSGVTLKPIAVPFMERFFEPFRRSDGRVLWPREAFVIRGVRT